MQKNRHSQSGLLNTRLLLVFALCAVGGMLAMLVFAAPVPPSGTLTQANQTITSYNGRSLPPSGTADFRRDLNLNGTIDSGDVFIGQKRNPSSIP